MIIYIASYPRSGNSMIRQIIHNSFQHPTTSVYGKHRRDISCCSNIRFWGEYNLDQQDSNLLWNEWVSLYDSVATDMKNDQRLLMDGCLDTLTPSNRKQWAAEETLFFIKTHELPFETYYKGEYVLQPIRHPGASFRSFYRQLIQDFVMRKWKPSQFPTIESIILGHIPFGSWNNYHEHWTIASKKLGIRYMKFIYNEVVQNPLNTRDSIAELLSIPVVDEQSPLLEKKVAPRIIHYGNNINWESIYTQQQLTLILEHHGQMMETFGFAQPDYSKAKEDDTLWKELARRADIYKQMIFWHGRRRLNISR